MPPQKQMYQKDEVVLCFHHDILYDAKILDSRLESPEDKNSLYEYRVHYKGWKHTWDDWVSQDRLRKYTEENKELASTLRRQAEAAMRSRTKSGKKKAADLASSRSNDERPSRKRGRETEIEAEEDFDSRPTIRMLMPERLKEYLVDDWEFVTKDKSVVPLPAKSPVNMVLDRYLEEEKNSSTRNSQAEQDVLQEVVDGLKKYFDKTLGRILLYALERRQYATERKKWESSAPGYEGKGPADVYGVEHLTRMLSLLPELLAQTNLSPQATNRLRRELVIFMQWLSKHADDLFTENYEPLDRDYVEEVEDRHRQTDDHVGTATARLFSDRIAEQDPAGMSRMARSQRGGRNWEEADDEADEEGEEDDEEEDEEEEEGDEDEEDEDEDAEESE
ncbi:Esa1p-associated factor [Coccidioides posadasii str. Silveira]|uniref:Chromatin modification-related protein EAF3 n=2 Tax=Coccidioides posadasii TaxID=199306 RepID=E9CW78_COCPS|nr:histone acetylase complex subunit [Coccidioides posadasii str. Silveira]KMM65028.1 MRG15 protein [Coccidioides posadasii RMSCC 3488]QVM07027.1 Esa1p-associated factor [Coccidioides posadasii str. Silveira]